MMNNNDQKYSGRLRNMSSVYLRKDDRVLLLYRQGNSIVSKLWIGSAGGHFEKEELNDAKACVLRELNEELSIQESELKNLTLRYVTIRYTDGELRQNYYFFADYSGSADIAPPSTEGVTRWFTLNEQNELSMPFTARHVMNHYVSQGQFDDFLYGGIANDNGIHFIKL